jgi:hypothetical protein
MPLPNFRKIFQLHRTEQEEKELANAAFFKFVAFAGLVVAFNLAKSALRGG